MVSKDSLSGAERGKSRTIGETKTTFLFPLHLPFTQPAKIPSRRNKNHLQPPFVCWLLWNDCPIPLSLPLNMHVCTYLCPMTPHLLFSVACSQASFFFRNTRLAVLPSAGAVSCTFFLCLPPPLSFHPGNVPLLNNLLPVPPPPVWLGGYLLYICTAYGCSTCKSICSLIFIHDTL